MKKTDLSTLDPIDPLPILSADKIISGLGLSPKLKSIERLSSAGNDYFNNLYRPAINAFVESVQLVPASAAHHHAGPGGLVIHTFDVIDTALRMRKSYNLPQYSTPEIIYAQEHIWSYAVFVGALLHDIGKIACNTRIKLDTGPHWTPHEGSIYKTGAKQYEVEFVQSRYKLHTQLANTFFWLIPPKGRGWLTQYPDILAQLTAWLSGDHYEFGAIGEIVRQADGISVATNLKIGGDRNRFPLTSAVPLVDRLTTALRELLDTGALKINRADGGAGWCDGQHTYLVCGTTADAVKQHLYNSGATDIPADNSRLFDVWQDHGYALSTPSAGAIWKVCINNALTLTVLKFETARLFHPSRRPGPFVGDLVAVSNDKNLGGSATNPTPVPAVQDLAGSASNLPDQTFVGGANNPEAAASDDITDPFGATSTATAPETSHVKDIDMVQSAPETTHPQPGSGMPEPTHQSTAPNAFDMDDPDIAHYFLDWIRCGIRDGKIFTNRSDALIHIVKEGVFLVSPLAFKKFIRSHTFLLDGGKKEDKVTVTLQKKLQRMMDKANLHRQTKQGLNIHSYQINGTNKKATIRGWLLPIGAIYGDLKPPDINKKLENLSGFK
ncbi:MAG: TraI domain-containing protein [Gammaproteobacteria bacterium]|nr:TraI domain-containing protein [Gammaproteobacteria bacterium]